MLRERGRATSSRAHADPLQQPEGRRITSGMRMVVLTAALACALATPLVPQEPVIKRSAPLTYTGEIVDISCYKSKGVAGGHRRGACRLREGVHPAKRRHRRNPHGRRRPLQDLGK